MRDHALRSACSPITRSPARRCRVVLDQARLGRAQPWSGTVGSHHDISGEARLRRARLAVPAVVAVGAILARLVPVLRGGGLFSLVSYDGAVYYTAASGLTQGLMPYRDFL